MTRLEPPPTSSTGSSASRIAVITSSADRASTNRPAGPPSRRVVRPAVSTETVSDVATDSNGSLRRMSSQIDYRHSSTFPAATVYGALVDPAYLRARLAELGGAEAAIVSHRA